MTAGSLLTAFAALPSTSNYALNSYGFGSGGAANTGTSNYGLEGITGELSGQPTNTTNYALKPGFVQSEQANVPYVTLSNPSSYYDKLKFVINNTSPNNPNNPNDALYALQVQKITSSCDFLSNVSYVQPDDTLGATLSMTDYQTYTTWGGSSGQNIIGLTGSTSYCMRAKVTQGKYSESAYGPSSTAATVSQSISFCLYTNANCGAGGTSLAFGNIPVNSVTNSPNNIGTDFSTNANNGGNVYIYSKNGGLKSASSGYTITSATANLAAVGEGFGGQITSISQVSGGPFTSVSPFNGSANNVGILSTTVQILATSANPLVTGKIGTQLQVKPAYIATPKSDYSETITVVAAGNF